MRFFADNSDYRKAVMTNREAHEEAAGMGLCGEFFAVSGTDPDAEYEPPIHTVFNCKACGTIKCRLVGGEQ